MGIKIIDTAEGMSMNRIICTCGTNTLALKTQRWVKCYWCNQVIDVKLEKQKAAGIKKDAFGDALDATDIDERHTLAEIEEYKNE